jgi:thioredoxin-like negative regulator of GroEL
VRSVPGNARKNGTVPVFFSQSMKVKYIVVITLLGFVSTVALFINQRNASHEQNKQKIIELGKSGQYDDSLKLLEELKNRYPNDKKFYAGIYYHIVDGYYETQRLTDAKYLLDKALREFPKEESIRSLYAKVLIKLDKRQEAEAVLRDFPHDVDSFEEDLKARLIDIWTKYNLAAAHSLLGHKDLAILYMTAVVFHESTKDTEQVNRIMEHVREDDDFRSIRSDARFLYFQQLLGAETIENAIIFMTEKLEDIRAATREYYEEGEEAEKVLMTLNQISEEVQQLKVVAPLMLRIKENLLDYAKATMRNISSSEAITRSINDDARLQSKNMLDDLYTSLAKQLKEFKRSEF